MARFRSRIKSRIPSRGVTLVELCVVLALLSVLAVMVTSFTVLTHSYSRKAARENEIRISLNAVERAFDTWVMAFDDSENSFSVDPGALNVLKASGLSLRFENGRLTGDSGGYDLHIDFELPQIDSVFFGIEGDACHCLVKCTVNYTLSGGKERSVTFFRAARAAGKGGT